MKLLLRTLAIGLLLAVQSCGSKRLEQRKLTGLNGAAIYTFNPDGTLWGVFKEEYNVKGFSVFLRSDTIKLGSEFHSTITVSQQSYRIEILNPSNLTIVGESEYVKEYSFRPNKNGLYEYSGRIFFDSTEIPFSYKFLVIPY